MLEISSAADFSAAANWLIFGKHGEHLARESFLRSQSRRQVSKRQQTASGTTAGACPVSPADAMMAALTLTGTLTVGPRPSPLSSPARGRDVADGLATSGVVCFHDGASLSFTVRAGLRLDRAGVGRGALT